MLRVVKVFMCSCFFFFSSRRRHTRSVSAFLLNRSSDLGEPLKATSYMAVGFYVAKYVNKKSDMDLAAKGLGPYLTFGFYVAKYVNKKSDMDLAAKGL